MSFTSRARAESLERRRARAGLDPHAAQPGRLVERGERLEQDVRRPSRDERAEHPGRHGPALDGLRRGLAVLAVAQPPCALGHLGRADEGEPAVAPPGVVRERHDLGVRRAVGRHLGREHVGPLALGGRSLRSERPRRRRWRRRRGRDVLVGARERERKRSRDDEDPPHARFRLPAAATRVDFREALRSPEDVDRLRARASGRTWGGLRTCLPSPPPPNVRSSRPSASGPSSSTARWGPSFTSAGSSTASASKSSTSPGPTWSCASMRTTCAPGPRPSRRTRSAPTPCVSRNTVISRAFAS